MGGEDLYRVSSYTGCCDSTKERRNATRADDSIAILELAEKHADGDSRKELVR